LVSHFFGAVISFHFLSALPFSLLFLVNIILSYTQTIHTTPEIFQHFYANNSNFAQDVFSVASNMELVPGCEEADGAQRNSRNSDIEGGKWQKQ
jgi:hypothetical protein